MTAIFCSNCGEVSDRGCIQKCRACSGPEWAPRCTSLSPDIYKNRCVKAEGHKGNHTLWPHDKGAAA